MTDFSTDFIRARREIAAAALGEEDEIEGWKEVKP